MDRLEQLIRENIAAHEARIRELGRDIWYHGEMGFKERRTAAIAEEVFRERGLYCIETGLAVTGVKGYLKEPVPGETVLAVIGEMDALPMDQHPDACPETGASHCCGHNAQMAGMLGAVYALTDPEIRGAVSGNVVFMAVPAEEFVDISFKKDLARRGVIEFGGGKCELIRVGAFDDVSLALGHHVTPGAGIALANGTTNGFVNKIVTFRGRSAHAADAPHRGVDALNAAMLALHAVDIQRETFRDGDNVRIHGFLPRAGEALNVVADTAVIESAVRANAIPAFLNASAKYDRAMRAGAMALGCEVTIETMPGYLPTVPVRDMGPLTAILEECAGSEYPMSYRNADFHENLSTDFGDLSQIMPVLQFRTGGYEGSLHNVNMRVTDERLAYVVPAEIFALWTLRLMRDGAAEAKRFVAENKPMLTKEEYVAYLRSVKRTEVFKGDEVEAL